MTAGAPWSVKGIDPKAREIAKDLARRSGMTLGEWLNNMIVEGGEPADEPGGGAFKPGDFESAEPIVIATPRNDAPPRYEISGHPADEVGRVAQALSTLTERIEAAEQRSTLAITGIDQSVRGALTRLEGAQREQTAVAARFEGLADDLSAEQARQSDRLRRVESEAAGPRSAEALRSLEGALGKVATHLYEGEARTREAIAAIEARVAEAEAAAPVVATAPPIDTSALVESVVERIDERLRAAEIRTTDALRDLGSSFVKLDGRLRAVEGGPGSGARLEALAGDLTRRMEAARLEMAEKLRQTSEGRFDRMDQRLSEMAGHVQLAEQRSAQAIEKMGREVSGMAETLSRRVQMVETQGHDALQQVGGEVARIAASVEQRLNRADTVQAQALEKLGSEIARITERLAERIANSERRGAQAIDEVGEQVARVTERIGQRQERATVDLSERIRQSEERTARLLDEAREKIDLSLNAAHKKLSEQVAQTPAAPPTRPAWPSEATGAADPFAQDPFAQDPFGADPFTQDSVSSRRSSIPEDVFAAPPLVQSTFAPTPPAQPAFVAPVFSAPSFEAEAPVHDAPHFPVDLPTPPTLSSEDFDAVDDFGASADIGSIDMAPEAAAAGPQAADIDPLGRSLSTREVIEQARAAARANFQTEARAPKPAKKSSLFSSANRGRRGKAASPALTGALALTGVAAVMGVVLASYMTINAGNGGKTPQRIADALQIQKQDGIEIQGGEADTTPHPRLAVALAPTLTPGQSATTTPIAPAAPPAPTGPTAVDLYSQATQKIEAKDNSGLDPLRKAANMGYGPAQFYLSKLYENGEAGLKKDLTEARRWTERAAQTGDRKAMHNLALDYFEGLGGERNLSKSADWFRRASDMGLTDSQYNLGQLYEQGYGVTANPAEAYKWYLIASRGGDGESRNAAERIKKTLTTEQRTTAERSAQGFRSAAPATLTPGLMASTAPAGGVTIAQKALSKLGYYRGPLDGAPSPALKLAVQAYQRDQGLLATGALDGDMTSRLAVYAR